MNTSNSINDDSDKIDGIAYRISKKHPHIRLNVLRYKRTNLCYNCGTNRTVTVNEIYCPECQKRSVHAIAA